MFCGTDTLLDTASDPTGGGLNVGDFNWPFHRFEITEPDTVISTVGGHFSFGGNLDIFGAIVQLSGPSDNPDAIDLTGSDVLATTLIPVGASTGLYTGAVNVTLQPGWYALQFGTGAFGAQPTGAFGSLRLTTHTTDLAPLQLVVVAIQDGHPSLSGGFSLQGSAARFVINAGETSAVLVNNVAPTVTLNSVPMIDENGVATLTGTITDPGTLDTFSLDVNWGDPLSPNNTETYTFGASAAGSQTFTLTHQYLDDNPTATAADVYTITATVTDDDGAVDTDTATITVTNLAPDSVLIDAAVGELVFAVGTAGTFSGSFTDPGLPDTHTTVWTFSHFDGTSTVVETRAGTVTQGSGSGTVSDSLSFTGAGVYTATLTVTDDDVGATTSAESMFVVYDPSAGFVTGGGWFISPEGAYIGTTLTGKANFGFVAKYKKGSTELTGQTEFQFKAGNLNFHSDEYIWLVIAGARAQYQGTGTINGSGNYGFKLTAIDGQVSGGGGVDKIRLKIWDKDAADAIVYDSGLGADDDADPSIELGGGKIIIHTKGNALQAAGGAVIGGTAVQSLSYTSLQPVVDQAIENWAYAGVDASQLNALSQIDVHLADLSGSYLGMSSASSNLIWIDVDAAGYGWGRGGMDLFSTVSHELGHQIGLDHDVMGTTLGAGSRQFIPSGLATESQSTDSFRSGFSLSDYAENRTSANSDNSDSERIDVGILKPFSVIPKLGIGREEKDESDDLTKNSSESVIVEDKSADDLFAEFNERLLDDLLAV